MFNEVILPLGHRPKGVRIDSGDIAYLSKKARKMLDEAGFADVKIVASNSLMSTSSATCNYRELSSTALASVSD